MKTKHVVLLVFLVYLISRLYFLFTFPPFTDESEYIRWGMLTLYNPAFRWAYLSYVYRQPLAIWLFGVGALLLHHPLYGARLVMLAANIPVFFLLWSVANMMFSKRIALWSLLILAVSPLFILTQTMAMMDGFLFAVSAAVLWLTARKWTAKIPWESVVIGVLLGIGLWIKLTAFFLFALVFAGLAWKRAMQRIRSSQVITSVIAWTILPALLILPMALQPGISHVLHDSGTFVMSGRELMQFPVAMWLRNFIYSTASLILYLNPALLLFLFFSFSMIKNRRYTLFFLWFAFPTAVTMLIGKHIVVRYFIVGTIAVVPLLAEGITIFFDRIKWKPVSWILIAILLLYGLFFTVNTPAYFHLFPNISGERDYAIGWPSGYGLPELTTWIDTHVPPDKMLLLAVADAPGNPTDYILAYYYFSPNIHTTFATLTNQRDFRKLEPLTQKVPLYLVARASQITPQITQFLAPVVVFPKPYHEDAVGLYEISFAGGGK